MSPKLFYRLRRCLDVAHHAWETDQIDWPQIALSSGYYDQSHLVNDFCEFAGVSPTTYLRRRDPSSPDCLLLGPSEGHALQVPA
jgi:AraC-like DNA-binding protein